MTRIRLSAWSPNGEMLGWLPAAKDISVQFPISDTGALTFSYPVNAKGAEFLVAGSVEIGVQVDASTVLGTWVYPANSHFLYLRDDRDVVTRGDLSIQAPGLVTRFAKAVVPPTSLDADGRRTFTSQTIGTILNTLFAEAQARGALSGLTWSFTGVLDSAGAAWTDLYTYSYEPGKDFLTILQELAALGILDFETQVVAKDNPGAAATIRTLRVYKLSRSTAFSKIVTGISAPNNANTKVLRVGRDVKSIPRTRSWEALMSAAIVAGDYGVTVTRTNGTTPWGRWETFVAGGGTEDTTTLNSLGDNALAEASAAKDELTISLTLDGKGLLPFRDYYPGQLIGLDMDKSGGGALDPASRTRVVADLGGDFSTTPLRVRQVILQSDGGSNVSGSLAMSDKLATYEQALIKRASLGIRGTSGFQATQASIRGVDTVGWQVVGAVGQPAFASGWSNLGGGTPTQATSFQRTGKRVDLRGLLVRSISGAAAGSAVFTVPVGYRITGLQTFQADGNGTAGRIDIDSTGALIWRGATIPVGGYLSLGGIYWFVN